MHANKYCFSGEFHLHLELSGHVQIMTFHYMSYILDLEMSLRGNCTMILMIFVEEAKQHVKTIQKPYIL